MYPNIYVEEGFFEFFDSEWQKLPQADIYSINLENENKIKSLNRIRELFLASNIFSNISDKSLIKYHSKQFGTYNNFKDLILNTAIKESSYKNGRGLNIRQNKSDINKSGICYFTEMSHKECIEETNHTGKIVLGKDFLQKPFYLDHTFANESTNEKIYQIERAKHPCTGIIVVDRYLFDETSNKLSNKISNLITFLQEAIPSELSMPFELDIITENRFNNNLFEKKYNQLLEAFFNKISLHIYAPDKIEHDRHIITNYATFFVGLPFVGESFVSCNFFPSNTSFEGIKNSYKIWKDKINVAINIVRNTPESIGAYKYKWKSDQVKHSIFNI